MKKNSGQGSFWNIGQPDVEFKRIAEGDNEV